MPHVVGNQCRTQLHSDPLPDGPLSPRQRALCDAIRGCASLSDTSSAPASVTTTVAVCAVSLGTSEAAAAHLIEQGLARAEAELLRLRQVYDAYGPRAFMPRVEPDKAPRGDYADRHQVLTTIMHRQTAAGRVMVRAGDRRVSIGRDGGYELAPTSEDDAPVPPC